ncbi:helix-turn-helix transcriptional regulator [Salinarimonas rosea]|uniref:helix-turn-helix transcriptional regulator n=1 Tax=Salinarimonas rosea TaxID=552063 RepID=UPI00041DC8A1|nr:helix-turn-helix transcriptional regulator [Salinarimonas rosea]
MIAAASPAPAAAFGDHLRSWRRRRRLSQLDLALDAEISQKHLSFCESGRARPSRDMVVRLAERLEIPLRERNALLLAAGYAPLYPERPLDAPELAAAREAVALVLEGHEPYPALAVDRHWSILATNAAVAPLLDGIAERALLAPPANALRLSLHPGGLAPMIVNLGEWRAHLLERLARQVAASADEALERLLEELRAYPAPPHPRSDGAERSAIAVPLRLRSPAGELAFISTVTVFGTPTDITLSEIAIEAFFPADEATKRALRVDRAAGAA